MNKTGLNCTVGALSDYSKMFQEFSLVTFERLCIKDETKILFSFICREGRNRLTLSVSMIIMIGLHDTVKTHTYMCL